MGVETEQQQQQPINQPITYTHSIPQQRPNPLPLQPKSAAYSHQQSSPKSAEFLLLANGWPPLNHWPSIDRGVGGRLPIALPFATSTILCRRAGAGLTDWLTILRQSRPIPSSISSLYPLFLHTSLSPHPSSIRPTDRRRQFAVVAAIIFFFHLVFRDLLETNLPFWMYSTNDIK